MLSKPNGRNNIWHQIANGGFFYFRWFLCKGCCMGETIDHGKKGYCHEACYQYEGGCVFLCHGLEFLKQALADRACLVLFAMFTS
jgi:hypothetical protein